MLKVGSTYSEADLQQALHRVERLPFVVSADFALRRGSERGRFALVVKVVETMPVFAGGDLGINVYSGSRQVMATEVAYVALPEVGARRFFGGENEVTATLRGGIQVSKRTWTQPNELDSGYETRSNYDTDFDKGYAIGYTRHNLFGRNLVAKVALSGGVGGYSNRLGENFRTSLALPLSRSSVVQAEFGGRFHEESLTSTRYQGGELTRESRYSSDRLTVNWQSDTTDDPFTPRQGRRIGSTLEHGWSYTSHPYDTYFFPDQISRQLETRSRGIVTEGRGDWFWPLTNRVSMGAGATLGANVAKLRRNPHRSCPDHV